MYVAKKSCHVRDLGTFPFLSERFYSPHFLTANVQKVLILTPNS